ncbi:MAG: transcription termination factor NusA [Acidobacteriota bacterium]
MANEILQAIEHLSRDKGIEVNVIISAVEDAIVAAAKKFFRSEEPMSSRFDRESGILEVFAVKTVVEKVENPLAEITLEEAKKISPDAEIGSMLEFPKSISSFGRIAAQAAKQVIFQKVKEAERENIYQEYSKRIGEIINGTVKRFEHGDIIIDIGKTEALLPKSHQSKAEHYNQGDRIRAVIIDVDRMGKTSAQVIVSRTDELLIRKLFEMEVPEIYDGTVQIKSVSREPGERTKIAVKSKDKDIDPIGACVGMKGTRVQSIIRELRGEKIDIIHWNDDPVVLVTNALSPASINKVTMKNPSEKVMEVIVSDDQLSLTIGKKGQNVRLASALVGWKLDIKSESEKKAEIEVEMDRIARATKEIKSIKGIGSKITSSLLEHGFRNLEELRDASMARLTAIPGIGEKTALRIHDAVAVAIKERELKAKEEEEEAADEQSVASEEEE